MPVNWVFEGVAVGGRLVAVAQALFEQVAAAFGFEDRPEQRGADALAAQHVQHAGQAAAIGVAAMGVTAVQRG
ncbi:hypothetical protein G6F31_021117 [Rhizopus arrhizus]|nr:hypothetical protein G6F31_021117 [Rhizopus arrhizus]